MKRILLLLLVAPVLLFSLIENSTADRMNSLVKQQEVLLQPFALDDDLHEQWKALVSKVDEKIRLVTYNVLLIHWEDKSDPANFWKVRKGKVIELLAHIDADIMALQEVSDRQLKDLKEAFSRDYDCFTTKSYKQEWLVFFWKRERFEKVDAKAIDLSSKEAPSGCTLLLTARFLDKKSGKTFRAMTTHFSFGDRKRRFHEALNTVNALENFYNERPDEALIFAGDLNLFPARLEEPFPAFDGDLISALILRGSPGLLLDAHTFNLGHLGPTSTYTNSPPGIKPFQGTGTPGVLLDKVYVSRVLPLLHGVEAAKVDGSFPSDHLPVIVDLLLVDEEKERVEGTKSQFPLPLFFNRDSIE